MFPRTSLCIPKFLAVLPRSVYFHSGVQEGPQLTRCLLIVCGRTPIFGGILTKTGSFLESRLVGELAGNQAGLL